LHVAVLGFDQNCFFPGGGSVLSLEVHLSTQSAPAERTRVLSSVAITHTHIAKLNRPPRREEGEQMIRRVRALAFFSQRYHTKIRKTDPEDHDGNIENCARRTLPIQRRGRYCDGPCRVLVGWSVPHSETKTSPRTFSESHMTHTM